MARPQLLHALPSVGMVGDTTEAEAAHAEEVAVGSAPLPAGTFNGVDAAEARSDDPTVMSARWGPESNPNSPGTRQPLRANADMDRWVPGTENGGRSLVGKSPRSLRTCPDITPLPFSSMERALEEQSKQ